MSVLVAPGGNSAVGEAETVGGDELAFERVSSKFGLGKFDRLPENDELD